MAEHTRVHVVRHGEVDNPTGVLYGRLPGYHLSDKGRAQAQAVADALAERDIVAVIASPLERAQETAGPIAAKHGLPVDTDPDLIESANFFEGRRVGPGQRHVPLRPLLPRAAGRGRLPAVQPLRGVVRLGRARRHRIRAHR